MSGHDVLVVGESLIDVLCRPQGFREVVGGSPANVALGVARLGLRARLHTAIADDERGRRIAGHLAESSVTVSDESWSLAKSSSAVVTVDSDGLPSYEFAIDPTLTAPTLVDEALVHVGSVAAFVAPGADTVAHFLTMLPASVIVTLDPNVRAALIPEHTIAVERFEMLCRRADVVKLSDEDLRCFYPGAGLNDASARITALGPSLVAVTAGGGSTLLRASQNVVRVPVPFVDVRDTVGAGDSFMAALICGIVRDGIPVSVDRLQGLGTFATRAAAVTVTRDGADLPWAREVEVPNP